jgi:hypothetical protein
MTKINKKRSTNRNDSKMAGGKEEGEGNADVVIERRVRRISEEKFGRGRRRGLNTPHRLLGQADNKPSLWILLDPPGYQLTGVL